MNSQRHESNPRRSGLEGDCHDPVVAVLANQRLRLRAGLRHQFQPSVVPPSYLIEDPASGHFYRVGVAEYTFLSLLDGERTVAEALAEAAGRLGAAALDEQDAAAICRWLCDTQLAATSDSAAPQRLQQAAARLRRGRLWERVHPLAFRWSLGNPDPLLERLRPGVLWATGRAATLLGGGLILSGLGLVGLYASELAESAPRVLRPQAWATGLVLLVLLKLWHEVCHAVVAKSLGGTVPDAGLVCFLGAPLAYVDLSSTYRFARRGQRIAVALAGVYGEWCVAAVAAWVWCLAAPGPLRDLAWQCLAIAGAASALVNLNPLLKFDGYFVLTELLGTPNLSGWGQRYAQHLARRLLWGAPSQFRPPVWGRVIRVYAVAAAVWRFTVTLGIVLAAAHWLSGLGLVVSLLAAASWWAQPLIQLVRSTAPQGPRPGRHRARAVAALSGAVATLLLAAFLLPWPLPTQAPATVVHESLTAVHTAAAGFVEAVSVTDGQEVAAGQQLLRLRNPNLLAELDQLRLQLRSAQLRRRSLLLQRQTAARQAQDEEIAALEVRLADKQREVDQLVVCAPRAGTVIGRQLEQVLDRFLPAGTAVCSLVDPRGKRLRASIDQRDQRRFAGRVGQTLCAAVLGYGRLKGARLVKVEPRAVNRPSDAALTVAGGGSLAVRPASDRSSAVAGPGPEAEWELETARFTAEIALDPRDSAHLAAGQTAVVGFYRADESIARHLWRRWLSGSNWSY